MWLGIIYIIIALASIIIYLRYVSKLENSLKKEGNIVLKRNKIFGEAGIFFIIFTCIQVMLCLIGIIPINYKSDITNEIEFIIFADFLSIPLILISYRMRVIVNENVIKHYREFGKTKEIKWGDITRVDFCENSYEIRLSTSNIRISFNVFLKGFKEFEELMAKKINYDIYYQAINEINKIDRK